MRHSVTSVIVCMVSLFLPLPIRAEIPCDAVANPVVCAFLNRYVDELQHWSRKDVPLSQKMYDDKFVILDGALENLSQVTDITQFSLVRYDHKAYEASWRNGDNTLLRVAFPIQYELLLGMTQQEIEKKLYDNIHSAQTVPLMAIPPDIALDTLSMGLFRSAPMAHYQIPELNNCVYYCTDEEHRLRYVDDTTHLDYTVANLFHCGLGKHIIMQVTQNLYGFNQKHFTISLEQWLSYCRENALESYVAIEEQNDQSMKVLIVAESVQLGYNHILSVMVPVKKGGIADKEVIAVRLNAFIPTHNVATLYKEYTR